MPEGSVPSPLFLLRAITPRYAGARRFTPAYGAVGCGYHGPRFEPTGAKPLK